MALSLRVVIIRQSFGGVQAITLEFWESPSISSTSSISSADRIGHVRSASSRGVTGACSNDPARTPSTMTITESRGAGESVGFSWAKEGKHSVSAARAQEKARFSIVTMDWFSKTNIGLLPGISKDACRPVGRERARGPGVSLHFLTIFAGKGIKST